MITARVHNRKSNYVVAIAALALLASLALAGAASGSASASARGSATVRKQAVNRVTATAPMVYSIRPLHTPAATGTATGSKPSVRKPAGRWAANAWWTWRSGYGWTLSITPTGLAQAWGTGATSRVWNDALAIAGTKSLSSGAYSSMYEQLECHLYFRFKTPYNLDSWRPQVAWWYELYRLCNP